MGATQAMPVKLSGELVDEARSSAAQFHRSLTGQIEHWATLGRAVEAQLPGDVITKLLERVGGTMKIGRVTGVTQRQQVMAILADVLGQAGENVEWLREFGARGIPLYGTEPDKPNQIVRLNPDGSKEIVKGSKAAPRRRDTPSF